MYGRTMMHRPGFSSAFSIDSIIGSQSQPSRMGPVVYNGYVLVPGAPGASAVTPPPAHTHCHPGLNDRSSIGIVPSPVSLTSPPLSHPHHHLLSGLPPHTFAVHSSVGPGLHTPAGLGLPGYPGTLGSHASVYHGGGGSGGSGSNGSIQAQAETASSHHHHHALSAGTGASTHDSGMRGFQPVHPSSQNSLSSSHGLSPNHPLSALKYHHDMTLSPVNGSRGSPRASPRGSPVNCDSSYPASRSPSDHRQKQQDLSLIGDKGHNTGKP